MARLVTRPNVADPDGIYQRLIEMHAGRSDEDSAILNAKLIMILVNHIGDQETIFEAIDLALSGRGPKGE